MSTNNETTLPVLPKTTEEYEAALQRARREGFAEGAAWLKVEQMRLWAGGVEDGWLCPPAWTAEARKRFPIRRKVRRRVHLAPRVPESSMVAESREDGGLSIRRPDGSSIVEFNGRVADALRDLLNNPTEEIEE